MDFGSSKAASGVAAADAAMTSVKIVVAGGYNPVTSTGLDSIELFDTTGNGSSTTYTYDTTSNNRRIEMRITSAQA